jgi:protein-L-isoaspartate(D-aspartate) O-methyltransferase
VDSAVENAPPEQLRIALTTQLVKEDWIRTPAVEAAFNAVPRHLFVPDAVTPAEAYANDIVATKRKPDGKDDKLGVRTVAAPINSARVADAREIAVVGVAVVHSEAGSGFEAYGAARHGASDF